MYLKKLKSFNMNEYLITYNNTKTIRIKHGSADLARNVLERTIPNVNIINSVVKITSNENHRNSSRKQK